MTKNRNLIINILITLGYAIFTLIIVFHHEVWSDEVQVWQLTKYLSIPELFKHLVNEGHPSLFYLLVMPFAKAGFSIFSMQILCWLSSVVAVFVLLQYSPFSLFVKLAIISSVGFLYSFPVCARNYSIIPILIFLAAILYSKQKEQPILYAIVLFLLAHTHIIMYGFTGILSFLFIYDCYKDSKHTDKKNIISASIMFLGLLLVFLQLAGTLSNNVYIHTINVNHFYIAVHVLFTFFANTLNDLTPNVIPIILYALMINFILLLIWLFKTSKRAFYIAFCGILFQFFIYIYSYFYYIFLTRIYCAYAILIFAFWIAFNEIDITEKQKKQATILLGIFFLFGTFNGIRNCFNDYYNSYSAAKRTAEFINQHTEENAIYMVKTPNTTLAIEYYLNNSSGKHLTFMPYETNLKYIVWNKSLKQSRDKSIWDKILQEYVSKHPSVENIYIIQSTQYFSEIKNTKFIYLSPKVVCPNEQFIILKYNTNKQK